MGRREDPEKKSLLIMMVMTMTVTVTMTMMGCERVSAND